MAKEVLPVRTGPPPIGPYSVAVEAAGLVFVSGQVAVDPSTGDVAADDIAGQVRRVMENLRAVLTDVGLGMEDVIKTTIFLADMDDFATVNEVYATYFDSEPPARSTVEVARLPGDFLVEIDAVAAR